MRMNSPFPKRIFVTVGTTSFDTLIRTIDSAEFLDLIIACGCKELVIQIGRGDYIPKYLTQLVCDKKGVKFEYFRFKPTLANEMSLADLIISHCGAGSVLEAVTLKKLLVVVINTSLQENHQEELAVAMASRRYCLQAMPSTTTSVSTAGDNESDRDLFVVLRVLAAKFELAAKNKVSCAVGSGSAVLPLLLSTVDLVEYPTADLDALPSAVDSLFRFA